MTHPTDERTWKRHPVFVLYEVSFCGQVRHIRRLKELKQRSDQDGYKRVNLRHNGRHQTVKVHWLVAVAFLGPPPADKSTVDHKDWNRSNNAASNLKYASNSENAARRQNVSRSYDRDTDEYYDTGVEPPF